MLKICLLSIAISIASLTYSQNLPVKYAELTKKADSLFNLKQYTPAISYYNSAFESNAGQGTVKHRYNLACCWASVKNTDSAFFQLNRIASKGKFYNYYQLSSEPLFAALKKDSRWDILIELVKKNSNEIEEKLNEKISKEQAAPQQ